MCILFFLPLHAVAGYDATRTPIGYWKTIDDVTGKPKSILHIYQSEGFLYGQVVKIYPRPGHDQNELCTACKGPKHNQRIVGMIVAERLKQDVHHPSLWTDGQILDPMNGKTYRCYMQMTDNGQKLNVRGYIGITLFGRSQTWLRVPDATINLHHEKL
ncbi:MAG: DUF2147 domain-containing protein [Gammaproteobacteria bacterium]|nr:DUF2147 domain-containing protein [Gammaproteobacteria bacterium]MCW5583243.1 DUF2147 domain-containing protein [Gammaproteobacteria bacterium]